MREVSDARKTPGPGGHMPPPNNWARGPAEVIIVLICFIVVYLR